ncbi:phage baseplate assembly protein V [Caballeronia sp. LZ001]|uniref:phage baseplate assembly protein V n=1 Tax=Caballeronia sp. LZ001 TaxID=3038553 RepID=UPI002858C68B|nr:phage baseplate assembly protein V [Caballeronia sp. LZ001]MDR5803397.1 phage baseplate assembly protein V [Caballeronia sp. LZ001]
MIKDIDKRIMRALAGIRQAFRGIVSKVSTEGPVCTVRGQALANEDTVDLEMFQHYGFTSAPPTGAMQIILPLGGRTSHGVVIATEHGRYRMKALKQGEVAIYTDEGDSIVLSRGRVTTIRTGTLNIQANDAVNIDSPSVNVRHQLNVAEAIVGRGGLSITGGDGANVERLNAKDDIQVGGKSVKGHRHAVEGKISGTPI